MHLAANPASVDPPSSIPSARPAVGWRAAWGRFNGWSRWAAPLSVDGATLRPPTFDRRVAAWLHARHWRGRAEQACLTRWVQPGSSVLDVGANQGLFTLLLARLVGPRGRVHAFEPEAGLFTALQAHCRDNGCADRVRCYPYALGAASGSAALLPGLFNLGDNRLQPAATGPGPAARGATFVPVRTLTDALGAGPGSDPGPGEFELAKVDVQGAEFQVFRGMADWLGRARLRRILFEFWPAGLRRWGDHPAALLEFLNDLGYEIGSPGAPRPLSRPRLRAMAGVAHPWFYTNLVAVARGRAPSRPGGWSR